MRLTSPFNFYGKVLEILSIDPHEPFRILINRSNNCDKVTWEKKKLFIRQKEHHLHANFVYTNYLNKIYLYEKIITFITIRNDHYKEE